MNIWRHRRWRPVLQSNVFSMQQLRSDAVID
ncbi:hypothetical protein MT49_1929 [Mycobacterium tuberculosis 49-02]|nr:hypothetical protein MT49_1929 [Mycobacterium tuberculosis 49-02]